MSKIIGLLFILFMLMGLFAAISLVGIGLVGGLQRDHTPPVNPQQIGQQKVMKQCDCPCKH